VVQHLDPTQSSILTEILQRSSCLPVLEVRTTCGSRRDMSM
jgi:chemotaxis response regulator CheB